MNYIGIDIGSTASKVVILGDNNIKFVIPTGWNSKDTADLIKDKLLNLNIDLDNNCKIIATGYGRIAVNFAHKVITEITCHGVGGAYLAGENCTIIDVGGQDTKVIIVENNTVSDFIMNDKCSAGTGKFIEIMANRLCINIDELFNMAKIGNPVSISSMCTVFAESEIISLMGQGTKREDIASGIVDSVATKVTSLCQKKKLSSHIILTGGLSHSDYFASLLSKKLKVKVKSTTDGRYAGALGAALLAKNK
ncbi:acyl-CoA dehydratase activase [Terrisporobacter sp.]